MDLGGRGLWIHEGGDYGFRREGIRNSGGKGIYIFWRDGIMVWCITKWGGDRRREGD